MKTTVKVAPAAILLCIALMAPYEMARAQEDETDEEMEEEFELLQDSEIVLAAAKHKQKIEASPAAVIVITRREIEESGAIGFMQLMRLYPPLWVYEFDPLYPNAQIRGTLRVLIRIDGRDANPEFFPSPFYEILPIALEDIERIEIVLGPNSALYGANAVSAVIDITTRKPAENFSAEANLAGGEHGQLRAGLRLEGRLGPLAVHGTVRLDQASSWMEQGPPVRDLVRALFCATADIGDLQLRSDASLVAGKGSMFSVLGTMDFETILFPHAGLSLQWGELKGLFYWSGVRSDFFLDLDMVHPLVGSELARLPKFHLAGDTVHGELQYDLSLADEKIFVVAGLDAHASWYRSEQLVQREFGDWRTGMFLHGEVQLFDRLRLTAGGRLDYNSITPLAFSKRGAAVFDLAEGHTLRLSAGSAYRKPALIETSAKFKVIPDPAFATEMRYLFEERGFSNPDLENEILTGFELGYRGSFWNGRLKLTSDVYFNMNRNYITLVTDIRFRPPPFHVQIDLENSVFSYQNRGGDFDLFGISLSAQLNPFEWLTLFARGEWRHFWGVGEKRHPIVIPPWNASIGGTVRFAFSAFLQLALVYNDSRQDILRNPESSLLPNLYMTNPASLRMILSFKKIFELPFGSLDFGIYAFNVFEDNKRDKAGTIDENGLKYGGEIIGRLIMFSACLRI